MENTFGNHQKIFEKVVFFLEKSKIFSLSETRNFHFFRLFDVFSFSTFSKIFQICVSPRKYYVLVKSVHVRFSSDELHLWSDINLTHPHQWSQLSPRTSHPRSHSNSGSAVSTFSTLTLKKWGWIITRPNDGWVPIWKSRNEYLLWMIPVKSRPTLCPTVTSG